MSTPNNEPDPNEVGKHVPSTIVDILSERGYTMLGRIGKGSYANVYVCRYQPPNDHDKRVYLACKMIDTKKVPKHFTKRFLPREIDVMRKVKHPNIVAVHSIFSMNTLFLIFMTYASRGDMLNFITKNGAIKEAQAYVWFRQLVDAVTYLHDRGIAHRDLKCENLLFSSKYVVKVTDFGFARFVTDEKGVEVKSKTYCGSVSYAAPELISGTPYDPKRSDMWSTGIILYVMLNKAMPFDDSNIRYIYESQISRHWRFRDKVAGLLSDDVKTVVTNLLQPNVSERWTPEDIRKSNWFAKNQATLRGIDSNLLDDGGECEQLSQAPQLLAASVEEVDNRDDSEAKLARTLKRDNKMLG